MTPDDIAGTDTDQAAYAEAAHGRDTRPDADESVAAIRALCDLCETHDLPVPLAITPAQRGWDVTRVQVDQDGWAAWHYALRLARVYIGPGHDVEHHIGNGDHAGHRYQLVSVVG